MKEEIPRVFGYRASQREARLWWVFKLILTVVTCVAAIEGVRSVYERAANGFGFDFYQFWLGGDALREHVAGGKHGVLDVYTDAAHVRIGARYVEMARAESRRQLQAAEDRKVVDTASSPFFYWVFSIFAPGDYDRDYRIYIAISVACMVGTIIAFAWRLGYSIAAMGAAVALAAFSAPVYSEFIVVNLNFPELAVCFFYLLLRERARDSARFAPVFSGAAGVVMGLLAAFKPNLLLFPALLAVSGLVSRRWRGVLAEAGGFAIGVLGAVAVSSWAFEGLSCWLAWGKVILALGSRPMMPSGYGNFSITRNIYEITGRSFVPLFSAGGIALAIVAIWVGRRSSVRPPAPSPLYSGERAGVRGHIAESRNSPEKPLTLTLSPEYRGEGASLEFRHDLAVFGLAVAVTLLSSGLAWLHYPILLFPFLLLVGSRFPGRIGIPSQAARYLLLSIVVILLLLPPAEEIQKLLPFHIDGSIVAWIHCTQAAVVITLGLALWFESRLLLR